MKKKFTKLLGIGLTIALLTSLLISAVPAVALTQPQVSIPMGQTTIGATATYTITFTAGASANNTGDEIVIGFPAGTNLGAVGAYGGNVNIEALAGIGGPAFTEASAATAVTGVYPAAQTLTITLGNPGPANRIGAGALVGLTISGIINTNTPGSYTLTLATQTGATPPVPIEAAVTSAAYTITAPGITPLPGVVLAYNAAGILMSQSNLIQTGVTAAGIGGRIEVGPGTYDEDVTMPTAGQTLIATGGAGTVIISNADMDAVKKGTITVTAAGTVLAPVVIDGFTFTPSIVNSPATPVNITTGTYVTVKNCTITGGTVSGISVGTGANMYTITGNTITAAAVAGNTGIVTDAYGTISNNIISVGALSQAITNTDTGAASSALLQTVVSGNTITGASGNGILSGSGFITIMNNTLTTLSQAILETGGTATISSNTITGCGGTALAPANAVQINGAATTATIYNNVVKDTPATQYAFGVTLVTSPAYVSSYYNSILNNTLNVVSTVAANFTHNWWGSAAGPAATSINGALVATVPALGTSTNNAAVAYGAATLLTQTTVGVDVAGVSLTGAPSAMDIVAVSKYDSNPQDTAPVIVGTGSVLGYYDVYISDTIPPTSIQLKFYGSVTAYTKLYYGGALGGQWGTPSNWGINAAGGYAYCTITGTSSPSINDMSGTPFALVDDKTVAPPAMTGPTIGAYDISIEPMFTWGAVVGAIRYEIALSEDPTFTIIEWSYNVDDPFYKVDEALRYDTTYYWRVRGVLGEPYQQAMTWITPSTPWVTGIFTTESEPVEVGTAVVVESTKPEVNVEIPPTKITVEPAAPAIPTYMLWVIVAVGAVLIIALIVLIVRTRRVV